ncbi:MAG: hypothetical protein JXB32_05375 [Deltaproteobacteria bacterium]|nr:hypothetical protein [Deltaproteobacteria bacterium]
MSGCDVGNGVPIPSASVLLDPPNGRQGTDQVVIVRGSGTAFTTGECAARFAGAEAEVALVQVETDDRIRLLVSIPADSPEGTAPLELDTPSGTFSPSFTILPASVEVSVRFIPDAVVAGFAGEILVTGRGTRFEAGVTRVSFEEGSGLLAPALEVESATRLRLLLDVPTTTPGRAYGATVSTGAQVLGTTLRVLSDAVPSLEVRPPSAVQGSRVSAEVLTHDFPPGDAPVVEFPYNRGVTVVTPPGVVVHSAPGETEGRLAVELDVAPDAPIGFTTLRVRAADGREVVGAFTVLRADDTPTCTFLSTVRAGDRRAELLLVGRHTEFLDGGTTAEAAEPYVTIDDVVHAGSTTVLVVASVDADAPVGPVDVTLRWPPDASVACPLTVGPAPAAALAFTPDALEHPLADDEEHTLALEVVGLDLTTGTPRLEVEPGSGIAVRSLSVDGPTTATAGVRVARDAPFGSSTFTLTLDAVAVSADVRVTRAAGDAPALVPGYVLLDGAAHDLVFRSVSPPLLDGSTPWFDAVRSDTAALEVVAAGPASSTEQPLTARPALPATAGHRTIGAHGPAALHGPARHLAVRLAGVPVGGRWGSVSPAILRAGRQYSVLVTMTPPELTSETVVAAPRDSGLEPRSLLVYDPGTAYLGLGVDQTAPAGDHVLVLRTATASFPAVVETETMPTAEASYAVTTAAVPPGTTEELVLAGVRTAWTATTRAAAPSDDPDLTLGGLAWLGASSARLSVTAAAEPRRPGGHVVLIRTDYAVAPVVVWLASPPLDLHLSPGWLHAGREETLTISGSAVGPAADAGPDEGLESAEVTARAAGSLDVTVRAADAAGLAVLAFDATGSGSFVPLVLPVLPASPAAFPTPLSLPRTPGFRTITARLPGLDVEAGIAVRTAGAGLWAGNVRAGSAADELLVDAALDLDAPAADRRWLVFLGEVDAAAMRLLPGGDRPRELALGAPEEIVTAAPGLPALRRLSAGGVGLSAVRATCDDPTAATVSLVAGDGATVLVRAAGDASLPHALPVGGAGAGFLAVEAERPITCVLRHLPWVELEPTRHDLEPNDDPDEAEGLAPAGGPAHRQLGVLADGYDIDRYRVELAGPACLEVFAGAPADFAPRAELALETTSPGGTVTLTTDPWNADGAASASVCVAEPGTWLVAVRAVAGSDGPYVLSLRPSVVLAELDLWSGGTRFLELAAGPGMSLEGWHVEQRSATGTVTADLALAGTVPADGLFVVAADAALDGADAVWTELDAAAAPVAFAVVAPDGSDVDLLGLAGATGEGRRLDPPTAVERPAALGRCLRVDTDDNATDFWRQRVPTPGAANVCEYR